MNTFQPLHLFRLTAGLAIAGAAALLAAEPAQADEGGVLGKGPPQGKTLSRGQLRECLHLQDELEAKGEAAVKGRAELDAAKTEFDRFEAQLQGERGSLDAGDKAAVDAYNAKLDQRKRMVADYEARRPQVQQATERFNTLRQEWKAECENRPYREADYNAVGKD